MRGHGDRVLGLDAADTARRPDDVRALDVRLVGRQMPDGHRHVDRLDDDASLPVQHAERVGEFQDVAEGLQIPVAAPALHVADIRRAVYRTEVDHVAPDVQVTLAVARMQHEALRRVRELRQHEVATEAHHLGLLIHERARAPVELARRRAADFKSGFLQNLKGRRQNPLNLFTGQHLQRRPRVSSGAAGERARGRSSAERGRGRDGERRAGRLSW